MLKIYSKLNDITQSDFCFDNELILLYPFMSFSQKQYLDSITKKWNKGIYSEIKAYIPLNYTIVNDIEVADYLLLPFKFNYNDNRLNWWINTAKSLNKKLLAFYNDDNESENTDNDIILFRTSTNTKHNDYNNIAIPPFFGLRKNEFIKYNGDTIISFVGAITHFYRNKAIDYIKYNLGNYKNNIHVLNNFFYMSYNEDMYNYYTNSILNSVFTLCVRGAGNFSYRFYETLSLGRIPLLLDTDTKLPFSNVIDWDSHIIRFTLQDDIREKITYFLNNKEDIMLSNYRIYKKYLSPKGFIDNFHVNIKSIK